MAAKAEVVDVVNISKRGTRMKEEKIEEAGNTSQYSDKQLVCIGFIEPTWLPLAEGSDTPYVVDEFGADGCTIPIYIKRNNSV